MNTIPILETQSPDKVKKFQEIKLKELLAYVNEHSVFYRPHFRQHAIDVDSIKQTEALSRIPPTTKDDIQLSNWKFICTPKEKISESTTISSTLVPPPSPP